LQNRSSDSKEKENPSVLNQVALVAQTKKIEFSDLTTAAAAIQKQVSRDVGPIWNINASVDAFASLEDVPLGYWHVLIDDTIPYDAQGIHLNEDNGQPFALIAYSEDWSLTTSHESIEMLVDPSGNRTAAANSPDPSQGRVLILLEACDPSEAAKYGYTSNGVLVSDFYTPHFFDPVAARNVRYSFTGAITKPLEVLDGGYVSWWDPVTKHVFQQFVTGTKKKVEDKGPLPKGFGTLRSFADSFTNKLRMQLKKAPPKGSMLTAAATGMKVTHSKVDASQKAYADTLRAQIETIKKAKK
jgi:hypothetical protein